MDNEALIERMVAGDRTAFDALVAPELPRLRSFLMRLVANPHDADDLVQETTLQAYRKRAEFRGESSFATWLFAIGSRLGLTLLRSRKRWAMTTQLDMHDLTDDRPEFLAQLGGEISRPEFRYQVAEHVAYCFSCIGRALDPEDSAAVILVEVFQLSAGEAAKMIDLSESTFRHRLSAGRKAMMAAFDDLCALVNKRGACHQCKTLRDASPADRQGDEPPELVEFSRRLAVVRDANVVDGPTARLHALMLGFIANNV
ncbi:MAG TPA: RNA polymerase sigma factor [Kofleriaceae bacterium]|nr:RNA polymerase sigma factor [Kofleriaceae bacterium]